MTLKLCPQMEYQITFLWKNHEENMQQKLVPDLYNFGK